MGKNDKGTALEILTKIYKRKSGKIITTALGDSLNDLPMLERVDYPILVQNHKGEYDQRILVPKLIKAKGIGPEGWREAVLRFIQARSER
jgi:mannosyl-3-phosphoglycerate phosphatase